MIKTPELWGRYVQLTDTEVEYYKCISSRVFYIRDIVSCDSINPCTYNNISEVPLHCTNPCLAMFWAAENRDSTSIHNYSNYTTNTEDLYSGWDPITNNTLKYGTVVKFDNMSSDHFSISEPRHHLPSGPCDAGYHAYSYAWDSTSYHGDTGIVFADMNAVLHCKVDDGDLFGMASPDGEEDEDVISREDESDSDFEVEPRKLSKVESPNFLTRVRLLVIRKVTIDNLGGDGFKITIHKNTVPGC